MPAPQLAGDALRAVEHRGSHIQIIASAGSGKTEVVSQRVAALLAEGEPAEAIVAFTFTERAAASLKDRIGSRVSERLGPKALDRLNGLYVGTIHAYCFRFLQTHVPRYETYDVLDDNRLTAFVAREATRLNVKSLDGRLFSSIQALLRNLDVIENELLGVDWLPEPLASVAEGFYEALERYRLLTYGQQIARAVGELERPELRNHVHASLRHLIVDEYQDINPAQEELIRRLTGPDTSLVVVGDDDQAIYQWRGSDVENIVGFATRYPGVTTFSITDNWRSRRGIVDAANVFAKSIKPRLAKTMQPVKPASDQDVVAWAAATETEEAETIADAIRALHENGLPYRDIAILVRGRVSFPVILDALRAKEIPVQPAGRTGLFLSPEAEVLAKTYCWLTDIDYRSALRGAVAHKIEKAPLIAEYESIYDLEGRRVKAVRDVLREWRRAVKEPQRPADLVRDFYQLLEALGASTWNHADPAIVQRLGTLARFTTLLADYESVRRRARADADVPGEQVGGQDRGAWYYKNLAIHIVNFANGAYEGFDGELQVDTDAVDLTTIHSSKGLEWPVVFVPSLVRQRFPSKKTGTQQLWLVPRTAFNAARYEGSDADERRLFYVAMTRAKDWLSLSRYERGAKNRTSASPYWDEVAVAWGSSTPPITPRDVGATTDAGVGPLQVTFSEVAAFDDCGVAYRLRNVLGFQPTLAPELGYGKAVHHVMRTIAEHTKATGAVPTEAQLDAILDEELFLPAANKPAHRQMKDAARRLVNDYVEHHEDDLRRVWMTERPFELHLEHAVVSGRADVILDQEGGVSTALAIVDYKTSTDGGGAHDLQLQVYTDAGRREGLDVRGAYVHDLKHGVRQPVAVDEPMIAAAEAQVNELVARMVDRRYDANPGARCRKCDVRVLCPDAQ